MHEIMILAYLAHLGQLWQIGFSKMIINGIFYDLGPPKGTNGSPTHGQTLYGGNWGEI